MLLLGVDCGSSSVKVAVVDGASGLLLGSASSPATELEIQSPEPGYAEQDPEAWWAHLQSAWKQLLKAGTFDPKAVGAIGISYQMHGLVLVDRNGAPLRPSIIWCDSRAAALGEEAFRELGAERCLQHLLNSPGNFTISKLAWIKRNEPEIFEQAFRMLLPGDYLAYRLTNDLNTTVSGMSEAALYDFREHGSASFLMDYFDIPDELLPETAPTFGLQGSLSQEVASAMSLPADIPVSYRAGDQPNNALSLNVLQPGQVATTAGTSGVMYAVTDRPFADPEQRVNTFAHVNYSPEHPRFGVLLCINGTGILYSWLKNELLKGDGSLTYDVLNDEARSIAAGCDGLSITPYGNGAERTLGNKFPGAGMRGLDFNRHSRAHIARAALEGIACALRFGLAGLIESGASIDTVRAGRANLFLSPVFREIFVSLTAATLEIFDTDGAQGAALGAGFGVGYYSSLDEALSHLKCIERITPEPALVSRYLEIFNRWQEVLVHTTGD